MICLVPLKDESPFKAAKKEEQRGPRRRCHPRGKRRTSRVGDGEGMDQSKLENGLPKVSFRWGKEDGGEEVGQGRAIEGEKSKPLPKNKRREATLQKVINFKGKVGEWGRREEPKKKTDAMTRGKRGGTRAFFLLK